MRKKEDKKQKENIDLICSISFIPDLSNLVDRTEWACWHNSRFTKSYIDNLHQDIEIVDKIVHILKKIVPTKTKNNKFPIQK